MRKLSYFSALVVAMTAVSCVEDINDGAPVVSGNGAKTFTATFDAAASKAVLLPGETESKVEWEAGDQVSVLAGEANYLYAAASAGATTELLTEATDVPAEGDFYAAYPYDADATLAEGVITTTLPAEQTAVKGSFSTHLAVAKAAENNFAFKNVCGLVKVTVDAENVTKIVFEGNNSEVVAGGVAVTVADAPTWAAVAEQGATSVTLAPSEGTLAKGAYYFAVLPQTFENGFKVTAYKGAEASVIRNVADEYTLERADIVGGRAFGIDGEGTEASPYILKTAQDMVDMRSLAKLGGETWFKMANDINMQGVTNYLPVNYDNNFERKIHFDGDNHTISNFTYDKDVNGGNYASLFGVLYGSVKNLKVDNANIISSNTCGVIGGYVGTGGKPGYVENVTVTNSSITTSGDRAGGICGDAKEATFKNVSFQGTITSTNEPADPTKNFSRAGGFVGVAETTATFENCSVDVTVDAKGNYIGGFAGYLTGICEFKNCVNNKATVTSTYTASQAKVGGFIGAAEKGQSFDNCDGEFAVTVSGNDAGGFAGYIVGAQTIKNCDVKTTLISKGAEKCRCGGFVGWNNSNATVTIENCHVLEGSSIKDESGRTANKNVNYGGFIGFGDNNGAVVKIKNCSAKANIDAGKFGTYVAGFVSSFGYSSTVTIENSYAECDIVSSQNYSAGFVGYCGKTSNVTITGCHFSGTVSGSSSVAGLVGAIDAGGVLNISKSYVTGTVNPSGTNSGGIIGGAMGTSTVQDCWANLTLNMPSNQYGAGIAGGIQGAITVKNCYVLGLINVSRGCGAILGQVKTAAPTVDGCIAWCEIKTNRGETQYSPGAVVGNIQVNGTFKNCYRKADMKFTDVIMKLVDHENVENSRPPLPDYGSVTADKNQYAYHGKAAAADATISSVATSLGWSSDVWDLSKDVPTLK